MLDDLDADGDWAGLLRAPAKAQGDYTLKGAYRLLVTLFAVALGAALLWPEHPLVDRFAPNAATEIFGIIITLAFVHRLLYRQERARRMRSSIGAYRRANWTLSRLVRLWADIVKGTHGGGELPRSLPRLFAPHLLESIGTLDLQRSVSEDVPQTWAQKLHDEFDDAMAQLNRVILSYSSVLDPAYTEAIDELIDHPFTGMIRNLTSNGTDARTWRLRMRTQRGHIDDFFQHLLLTVALHNRLASEAATVRSRGRSPRSGTLGMELERDADLRIDVELSQRWRESEPVAGSLRL